MRRYDRGNDESAATNLTATLFSEQKQLAHQQGKREATSYDSSVETF